MQVMNGIFTAQLGYAMAALYVLLGVVSTGVGLALGSRTSQLRDQVNAWWFIFPIVSGGLILYPLGAPLLALIICALAARELIPYCGPNAARFRRAAIASIVLAALVGSYSWPLLHLAFGLASIAAAVYWRLSGAPAALPWLLFAETCFGISFVPAFVDLPFGAKENLSWLFYLFIVTALNDIAQFTSGKLFGKQKIVPQISPQKTWQGLMGGVVVSVLLSLGLGAYLGLGRPAWLAIIAVLLSVGGFAGDVMFSAAKRKLGIKDFSNLIPGHGGMLDRADSLVITAPLLYVLLNYR
ncbi:phosphatidate cytidylyltransferase [Pseudoduganella violaceinigra]|uniref:phosphatidate cytidylyltransferase n=1 Tax=Pseudoduganella violaceinigra TaxID=246602 RepID=UPI000A01ED61|nr:phosphatidate cytidylyltransferase [Pseudoduganella violaceinigra]